MGNDGDHFVSSKDIQAADLLRRARERGRQQGIRPFFDGGRSSIAHTLLPGQGFVVPGDLMVGGDLHSLREGLLEIFAEAGAAVSTPTGGACFGAHMGILAPR